MEDKTMKKVFGMAALLLAMAACNKVETDTPAEQPSDGKGITITATLAPKTADNGDNKIPVTWAPNEVMAILYEVGGIRYVADASIKSVGANGSATIEFTVESGTPDNTACTLVYPAKLSDGTTTVYNDAKTGVKDATTLLAAQDGTLSANLDVRVGAGTIQTTTPSLNVTTQPAAQYSIFKFTVKNYDGSAAISAKSLKVTVGTQDYDITPAAEKDVLYAALPAVSDEKVSFDATDGSDRTYTCAKLSVSFEAGKYYQSTLKMREYVDLGITVGEKKIKWATCNVGAANPQDYGDYFAWGETSGKTDFSWATYKWMQSGESEYKYITKYTVADGMTAGIWYDGGGNFIGDNKTVLEFEDDAARANWGGSWRMPTYAEIEALIATKSNTTDYTWTWCDGSTEKYNDTDVKGWKIVKNSNSNTLFLPAAGCWFDTNLSYAGSDGCYWSSSLHESYSGIAWLMFFYSGDANIDYDDFRYFGQSVRPVTE